MYQAGGSIKKLLERVERNEYILPAIQREFVWKPEQICQLFDSLMQGYPIGTFLFWEIKPENIDSYQFYDFMQNYHERDAYECAKFSGAITNTKVIAVLDGQQRITALNIGLRGSYAWKAFGKRSSNNSAFSNRQLFINLLGVKNEETGEKYDFRFLTNEKSDEQSESVQWFRVGRTLEQSEFDANMDEDEAFGELSSEKRRKAKHTMHTLYKAMENESTLSYYEETDQSLEKVLNIFIRMNSGGTPLSYSDLLLSVATAQWKNLSARDVIGDLVKEMNQQGSGFNFSKDLVLKGGLMLSDIGAVGFKVENFNKENMLRLEGNWSNIKDSLLLASRLLAGRSKIASASVLSPID
jgi:uncharacterized protein with ParB-like and HNH nuclease domain